MKKTTRSAKGFALIIAINLMAFVLLLVLGLSTLVTIETQTSFSSQTQTEARQNALLGLQVAVGQLQKYAGPDQRITASPTVDSFQRVDDNSTYATELDPKYIPGVYIEPESIDVDQPTNPDYGEWDDKEDGSPYDEREVAYREYWNERQPRWTGVWSSQIRYHDTIISDEHGSRDMKGYLNRKDFLPAWLISGNEKTDFPLPDSGDDFDFPEFDYNDSRYENYLTPYMTDVELEEVANRIVNSLGLDNTEYLENYENNALVTLVGTGSAAAIETDSEYTDNDVVSADGLSGVVVAPKMPVTMPNVEEGGEIITGHYAYWVSDESQKANLALRDAFYEEQDIDSEDYRNRLIAPQRAGWEGIEDFGEIILSGTDAERDAYLNDEKLEMLVSPQQLPIFNADFYDPMRRHFHSLTTVSEGLHTDTRLGGLKKDLSVFLSDERRADADYTGPQEEDFIFTVEEEDGSGPDTFGSGVLRGSELYDDDGILQPGEFYIDDQRFEIDDYRTPSDLATGNTLVERFGSQMPALYVHIHKNLDQNHGFPKGLVDNSGIEQDTLLSNMPRWGKLSNWVNNSRATIEITPSSPTQSGVFPVVVYFQMMYGHYHNGTDDWDGQTYGLSMAFAPFVILWNPFDKPLQSDDYYMVANFSEMDSDTTTRLVVGFYDGEDNFKRSGPGTAKTITPNVLMKVNGVRFEAGEMKLFHANDSPKHDLDLYENNVAQIKGASKVIPNPREYTNNVFFRDEDPRDYNLTTVLTEPISMVEASSLPTHIPYQAGRLKTYGGGFGDVELTGSEDYATLKDLGANLAGIDDIDDILDAHGISGDATASKYLADLKMTYEPQFYFLESKIEIYNETGELLIPALDTGDNDNAYLLDVYSDNAEAMIGSYIISVKEGRKNPKVKGGDIYQVRSLHHREVFDAMMNEPFKPQEDISDDTIRYTNPDFDSETNPDFNDENYYAYFNMIMMGSSHFAPFFTYNSTPGMSTSDIDANQRVLLRQTYRPFANFNMGSDRMVPGQVSLYRRGIEVNEDGMESITPWKPVNYVGYDGGPGDAEELEVFEIIPAINRRSSGGVNKSSAIPGDIIVSGGQPTGVLYPDSEFTPSSDFDLKELGIRSANRADSKMLSIGQFQAANVSANFNHPTNAIGNSEASPGVDRAKIAGLSYVMITADGVSVISSRKTPNEREPLPNISNQERFDISYIMNEVLWDSYFLSSIPQNDNQDISGILAGVESLDNGRHQVRLDLNPTPSEIRDFDHAAAYVTNLGAFNVNSTSVDAWKSLLAAFRDLELDDSTPDEVTPFSRILDPIAQAVDFSWGEHGDLEPYTFGADFQSSKRNPKNVLAGYRYLSDEMLDRLAQRIVDEVRLRGPFYSLSDFVNRRLVSPHTGVQAVLSGDGSDTRGGGVPSDSLWEIARYAGDGADGEDPDKFLYPNDYNAYAGLTGLNGTLQRAINLSGINGGVNYPDDEIDGSIRVDDKIFNYAHVDRPKDNQPRDYVSEVNNDFTSVVRPEVRNYLDSEHLAGVPVGEYGSTFSHSPGMLSQGDLLASIGSALTARGDTFIVRSYGDSINPSTGKIQGRAWLEAVVQRVTDPVNPYLPTNSSDGDPWEPYPADVNDNDPTTMPPSIDFGREFRILSVRWLSEDEV